MGEYEQALADLTKAIELNPESARGYCIRGGTYKKMGQAEKAIADFERFLELTNDPQWRQMAEQQLRQLRDR